MRKLFFTLISLLAAGVMLSAQEEKEMKTGWSLGVLPTATYSVDNGFQAGAFGDIYYYGDGKTYIINESGWLLLFQMNVTEDTCIG